MEPDPTSRTLFGIALGGLGSLAVAIGLVTIRGRISNVNVALVLVVVVLGAAGIGGRRAGAMAGLVAATAFDFFHTRPYGLLKIARVDDIVTTLLLLVVGLVMGEVVERSGRFRERMRDDQKQLRRLHRVARSAAAGDQDRRDLVLTVTAELIGALRLQDCRFEVPPFLTELPHMEPDGVVAGGPYRSGWGGLDLPREGVDLRVVGPRGVVGRFVLVPSAAAVSSEQVLAAIAMAHALALALAPSPS